jgi:taurine dioxygenase
MTHRRSPIICYMATVDSCVEVRPVTRTIGAEVVGVELATLDDRTFGLVHRAFLERKVLFFRGQRSLDVESHIALGRRFGELMTPNVINTDEAHPELYVLETDPESPPTTDCWHVDSTYMAEPAMMSILRARVVPDVGGDTLWADMEAAYDSLSEEDKQRLGQLRTLNSVAKLSRYGTDHVRLHAAEKLWPPVEHPLVRTHPETGLRSIFINQMTAVAIRGLDVEEGKRLLSSLYALAANPDHQCRVRWEPDMVAMWDNRCTQHYATADYYPDYRRMERVTVRGDRPF